MTPTITIDKQRKCLSEQFYSYKRSDNNHFIRISLLNVPKKLNDNYKKEKDISKRIEKVQKMFGDYRNNSRTYTGVECLTLELELIRCGNEGEFEDDRTKNFRFFEEEIKTVYRFDFEEADQMIFGMEVTSLRDEISR